jgi:lysophospholipase L1-like esterase
MKRLPTAAVRAVVRGLVILGIIAKGCSPAPVFAQTTIITASSLKMGGAPITTGTVTFTPVDRSGIPIPFADASGAQNGPTAFSCKVIAGAITGQIQPDSTVSGTCAVPDATQTTPANILYSVQVCNTSTGLSTSGRCYTLQGVVGVSGSTWPLDHYGPPAQTTNSATLQAAIASTTPSSCIAPSVFTNSGTHVFYTCVGGVFVAVTGGSASVFGASGSGHSAGLVPDPGATAGTTRYLREDGSFAVPAGGGGSSYTPPSGTGFQHITSGVQDGAARAVNLNSADVTGTLPGASVAAATTSAQGAVQLPAGATSNTLGTAAAHPATDFPSSVALDAATTPYIAAGVLHQPNYPLPPVISGDLANNLLADYNFYQQSGTVLTDISGANACSGAPCNGTLGTGSDAPTWLSNGLRFAGGTQNVSLPTALNAGQTFVISLYIDPEQSTVAIPGVPARPSPSTFMPLLSSSLGYAGFNVFMNGNGIGLSYGQLGIYAYSSVSTQAINEVTGYHTITIQRGSGSGDSNQFFIDGTEVNYGGGNFATAAPTTGNLFLGVSPAATAQLFTGMSATFYRMRVYSTKLNSNSVTNTSDVVQLTQAFNADVAGRGVPTTPVAVNVGIPIMHGDGDSITYGAGSSAPGAAGAYIVKMQPLLLNQPAYTVYNWGIPGIQLSTLTASEPNRIAKYCNPTTGGASVALVFAGTNDLGAGNAAAIYAQLKSEVHILKQAGCKVFAGTMISRITLDAAKDAYNTLIRTGIVAEGADGIMDFNAIPQMGADGAYANSTYFSGDGIHPIDAGYTLIARAAANTVNYYYGHHAANPTIVTATTYQMLDADGFVNVQPTAATALTLPDCTGQTGAVYTVNNSQSVYPVTLKNDVSAHTINGVDYSTVGVTVPANGSFSVVDVPLSPTTGGCVWQSR